MQAALAAGARGQVVQMHGEFNRDPSAGTGQQQFAFTLAAFLITASDTAFFGFSDGWCAGIPDAVCVRAVGIAVGTPRGLGACGIGGFGAFSSRGSTDERFGAAISL